MKKMTNVEMFSKIAEVLTVAKAGSELVDFINEKIAQTEKRNLSRKEKPVQSKTSKEKIADMAKIEQLFDTLDPKKFYSSQEILAMIPEFEGYTPQKMTPRLNGLVENGVIVKGNSTKDKKKVGYKLVTDEQEAQEA